MCALGDTLVAGWWEGALGKLLEPTVSGETRQSRKSAYWRGASPNGGDLSTTCCCCTTFPLSHTHENTLSQQVTSGAEGAFSSATAALSGGAWNCRSAPQFRTASAKLWLCELWAPVTPPFSQQTNAVSGINPQGAQENYSKCYLLTQLMSLRYRLSVYVCMYVCIWMETSTLAGLLPWGGVSPVRWKPHEAPREGEASTARPSTWT